MLLRSEKHNYAGSLMLMRVGFSSGALLERIATMAVQIRTKQRD